MTKQIFGHGGALQPKRELSYCFVPVTCSIVKYLGGCFRVSVIAAFRSENHLQIHILVKISRRHSLPMTADNEPFEAPPQRHPTLYNSLGDIVLSTETNGVVNLFRVHKTTLSYHSPVFRDMFALPADPTANETYDGVPVVRMTDKYDELVSFLEVLYGQD